MSIKLIALDLDGTLLTTDKRISIENKMALQAARDKGVYVVLTTGRPLRAIEPFLEELGLLGQGNYSITFNGGLVQENTGYVLDKVGFGLEEARTIRAVTQQLELPIALLVDGTVYTLPSEQNSLYAVLSPLLDAVDINDTDLPDIVYNKAVTAIDAAYLDERIPQIPTELHDQFEIFKSRDILLEWSPKGVHKANGLAKLIQYLGIDASEVMACGDEENDLSMVEWAGLGVAMANANAKLKEVAQVVLPLTNDENGIAWAIEQYVISEE
ncbi:MULTISPECIES: Cof-type HAD-IIB family hydrolase [unclassified Streptococcus]|uniref:Cof-type HAD-IIB family hydrolase n=1 Tax=unclassified Streptococcus TaxID=2608887 RepID=UPI001072A531|nr:MULTISPECIES: Cof-type HAD-IIB family hydrolase [unclassified Streptococcus]MBF0787973.1 HAD family phosphatase [Streptococcus sp. 19428wC2_LYSM12]MCQ9210966.1 Cof-type HAD-IIB family hydrolase [Streptococcus sp. B01]MCQ9214236.1 Cof-type HAD-IIB family hydrolase [Streptococcus sp. O1]TFV05022.1 HAD family phosphatase [Streptococcus sp. LYSM12]